MSLYMSSGGDIEVVFSYVCLLNFSPNFQRTYTAQRQQLMIRPSVNEEQVFHEGIAVNVCGERCARRSYEVRPLPKTKNIPGNLPETCGRKSCSRHRRINTPSSPTSSGTQTAINQELSDLVSKQCIERRECIVHAGR